MAQLDEYYLDVYFDLETVPAKAADPSWPKYPPEIPFYEQWLEDAADRPHVRAPEEVKVGRRGPEKAAEHRAAEVARDEEALREWESGARDRYNALQEARKAELEELRAASALDPFLGGQVAVIALAIGEEGKVRTITPQNDPAYTPPPEAGAAVQERPEVIQHRLWLSRHREYRLLKRFSQGIQALARKGKADGEKPREVRLIAWNGFRFDFKVLALRAAARAHLGELPPGESPALKIDLDERGFDADLLWLVARTWHGVPWRSKGLVDPRELWAFEESARFVRGRLPWVAKFFGVELDEELLALDHAAFPAMLEGTLEERELVARACADDVRLLQATHSRMIDLGVGWGTVA